MSLICLVHGSTQNASGWDLLAPELRELGHETVQPNLPTRQPDASATVYADIIARAIPEVRDDVVVVAHSASGTFLPLVPERRRVTRLVFLAAVIPQIGTSLLEQLRSNPQMLNPEWVGKDPTQDHELANQFLFHDCSAEVARWALTTLSRMYAQQALVETCPLARWPDTPASYILCADDRTIRPEWSRQAARERLGVEAIELPGGHCPHVSRPKDLAKTLTEL
jgi:pimeloyl-ACP methyl ester carboxylesterase